MTITTSTTDEEEDFAQILRAELEKELDHDYPSQHAAPNNVVSFRQKETAPVSKATPREVVQGCLEEEFAEVIILGRLKNGNFLIATSNDYMPDILWVLKQAEWNLRDAARDD